MKIVKIEAIPITTPYRGYSLQSHVIRAESQSVLVKIHTDEGVVGIGNSGTCCRAYSGETQGGVMWVINHFVRSVLLGADPFNIEGLMGAIEHEAYGFNAAKSAIDNALWDLKGKALKKPVYELLGGKVCDKIPLHGGARYSWPPLPKKEDRIKEIVDSCVKAVEEGYKEIGHIKVGIPYKTIEEEVETFKAIRDAVGDDIKLSSDANCMWTPEFSIRTINKLDKVADLWFFEQPVHRLDIFGLAEVRRNVRPLIMADEGSWSTVEAMNLVRANACDMMRFKTYRAGGILKTREAVAICKAIGMPVAVCGVGGNDVNDAAYLHIHFSSDWAAKSPCGGGGVGMGTVPLTKGVYKREGKPAYLTLSSNPGLGFELDDEAVKKSISPGMKPLIITKKYKLDNGMAYAYVMDELSGIMR
jgi:L-alanine-DL-glutamate epimerase-like enolase superfamily enzyme